MSKMKKGERATVFHAGTNAFYEATIVRYVSKPEMVATLKASCAEDPRPDGTIFRDVLRNLNISQGGMTVYNDLNPTKDKRRLKLAGWDPVPAATVSKFNTALKTAFGDRYIESGVTKFVRRPGYGSSGGELFVRLTAY
jgi:hypothetical protein